MNIHDSLLAANHAGTLLETIAATACDDIETVTNAVSSLHNAGDIDILAACDSSQINDISDQSFFSLRHIFSKTMPQIESSVEAAEAACRRILERAGQDTIAGLVYESLTNWFRQNPARVKEGLALIRQDMDVNRRLVKPVLLAGADQDAKRSSEETFDLTNCPQMHIRLDAIWALGRVVPTEDERFLTRTLARLDEVIEAPESEHDIAHAVETALHLLHRTDGRILRAIESLLVKACAAPTPATVSAFASGLQTHRDIYSQAMVDATFSALQHTTKQDMHTIAAIDSILYQWGP